MRLRFGEGQIGVITGRYGDIEVDKKVICLRGKIQERGYLTKEELWKVARWKAARSAGNVKKNGEKYVEEITRFAFSTDDERARIEALTLLDGVSWPTASVILHLYHRDKYPILDFRALWSCGLEVPKQYDYSFWLGYVEFCREVSERNGVSMRELDHALWQYSKENQKG